MRLVVIYKDSPGMLKHRERSEAAHFKYLEGNSSEILIGGGLRSELGSAFVGSLLVLEVQSFARAKS